MTHNLSPACSVHFLTFLQLLEAVETENLHQIIKELFLLDVNEGLQRWTSDRSDPGEKISYCNFLTTTLFRGRRIRGETGGGLSKCDPERVSSYIRRCVVNSTSRSGGVLSIQRQDPEVCCQFKVNIRRCVVNSTSGSGWICVRLKARP